MNNKYVKILLGDKMKKEIKKETNILTSILVSIGYFILMSFLSSIILLITNDLAIASLIGYSLTLVLLYKKYKDYIKKDFKNLKSNFKENYKLIFISFIVFSILMYISNYIIGKMTGMIPANQSAVEESMKASPILMIIFSCTVGPLAEEFVMKLPYKNSKKLASFISYVTIFALLHVVGISTYKDALFIISYLLLSLAISFSYYKTNNIFISSILHIINNVFAVIELLITGGI